MRKINAVITGVGGYVPQYILDNEEMSRIVDTTDEWIMENGTIKSTVASNFAVMQIKNSLPKINAVVSQYYGSSVNFAVQIRQEKKTEEKEILPREVQLVCSLFSGRVVAEGEILETNAESKQEPSSNSEKTDEEQVSEIQTEYTEDEE